MHLNTHLFSVPKRGSTEHENEDAAYPIEAGEKRGERIRFALADGATESSFARRWAELLVKAFVDLDPERDAHAIPQILQDARPQWREHTSGRQLPWYAEESVRKGAFSSLLGLTLKADGTRPGYGDWRAVAVGDTCLIHMRNDCVLARFPLSSAASFDLAPYLLSSSPSNDESVQTHVQDESGECAPKDVLYLMTDALARWFLEEMDRGHTPWTDLNTREHSESFKELIEDLRAKGALRNDDCTLIRIDILPEEPAGVDPH